MADNEQSEMDPKVEKPLTDVVEEKESKLAAKADTGAKADDSELAKELEKTREALKKANKEAAERRKRLEELEASEQKRKEAEMTETEKLQARLKTLEEEKNQLEAKQREFERKELQRKVANEIGLPEGLARRIAGETEDEMIADAKAMLELLPKQEAATNDPAKVEKEKVLPKLSSTNPGEAEKGETLAQKKARLLGQQPRVWDADYAKEHGGGVTFVEDK
jgi:hypothetical protein